MKIKQLKNTHPAIYNRILELQAAQGNSPDDNLDIGMTPHEGNFWWSSSQEGYDVWEQVDSENYDSWYEHHKLKPKTIVIKEPKTLMTIIGDVAPSLIRIVGISFVAFNIKEIVTENTLIWIPGLMIFGLAEFIDLFRKIYYEQNR